MNRTVGTVICVFWAGLLWAQSDNQPQYPSFDYDAAYTHEIKPHRRTIPLEGMSPGSNQLGFTLTVSPTGDVLDATPHGDPDELKHWPQIQAEVAQWKFTPFEVNGKAVTAEVEEYVDLVPPERLPKVHVAAPAVRSNSKVIITLQRSGCYGRCPSYVVTVSTESIVFDGGSFVATPGKHTGGVDPNAVRDLAKKFVAADFYSMDSSYRATVTDNPTYILSIAIDGRKKKVEDYLGSWVGMPEVITDLEDEVDALAQTQRWIKGSDAPARTSQ
jgi:hypothetical protein